MTYYYRMEKWEIEIDEKLYNGMMRLAVRYNVKYLFTVVHHNMKYHITTRQDKGHD